MASKYRLEGAKGKGCFPKLLSETSRLWSTFLSTIFLRLFQEKPQVAEHLAMTDAWSSFVKKENVIYYQIDWLGLGG